MDIHAITIEFKQDRKEDKLKKIQNKGDQFSKGIGLEGR